MFKQFFRGVQDKYKQMQEEEARYQELLGKVFLLPKFNPYTPVDRKKLTISYKPLMNMCPDLNEGDAVVVRGIIPIDEYEVEGYSEKRYIATFKYRDVNYQLMGIMEKEEFDEIIKNLGFL